MARSIGLATFLTLAVAAVLGTSTAAAAFHIESCMEGGKTCKTASVGTTFKGVSDENFTFETEGKVEDECEAQIEGKVTDPTTEKAKDNMEFTFTKVEFSKCSTELVTATNLPWHATVDQPAFEETKDFKIDDLTYTTFLNCTYKTNPPFDLMYGEYHSVNPSRLLAVGFVVYDSGPFYCSSLRADAGVVHLSSVSDPNLTGATDLVVQ